MNVPLPKPIPERNIAIDPPGGVVRDDTQARAKGRWWDCDKIRFRNGRAEVIGGWTKLTVSALGSAIRCLVRTFFGKDKAYIVGTSDSILTDQSVSLDPSTQVVALSSDPIFISTGIDAGIKVRVPNVSKFAPGDYVTLSGLTAIGSNTTGMLNRDFVVNRVFNGRLYLLLPTGGMAGYTDGDGGGSSGEVSVTISARGVQARSVVGSRYWSIVRYGLEVVSCERNGAILRHINLSREDTTSYSNKFMREHSTANLFPAAAIGIGIGKDRSLIAFGSTPMFTETGKEWKINRRLVRWSDNQNPYDWESRENNTAGEYEIFDGTEIISWFSTRREHLIFLDAGVWSMRWVGAPYYYSFDLLMDQVGIVGPNAVCAVGDTVFWMGHDNFYSYNGSVRPIPCAVGRYVFSRLNRTNLNSSGIEDPACYRVCCGVNTQYNEIWWHYPSGSSTENDSYVAYNYLDNTWFIGSLNRSAMIGTASNPVMGDSSGDLYLHESGYSANGSAIAAHLESGDIDLGEGELVYRTKRLIPDLGFVGNASTVTYQFKTRDYPMGTLTVPTGGTAQTTVTAGTEYRDLSVRARQVALRISSNTTDGRWYLGKNKVTVQPDGAR